MLKRKIIYLFVICCVMACSLSVNAAPKKKVTVKTPFAVISDVKINKKKLKKDEVFQYQFKISFVDSYDYYDEDAFEGGPFMEKKPCKDDYYYVRLRWTSSKNQKIDKVYKWRATKKSKVIKGKIKIKEGMQTGKWTFSDIFIVNGLWDSDDSYSSLSISDGTKKDQKKRGTHNSYYTNLSFADFKVKGKWAADKEAPVIDKDSISVSKTHVVPGEKVKFCVKVKDLSKIKRVGCTWEYDWEISNGSGRSPYSFELQYNKEQQCYECEIVLDESEKKAMLCSIYTEDIYGNREEYEDFYNVLYDDNVENEYHDAFSKVTIYRID